MQATAEMIIERVALRTNRPLKYVREITKGLGEELKCMLDEGFTDFSIPYFYKFQVPISKVKFIGKYAIDRTDQGIPNLRVKGFVKLPISQKNRIRKAYLQRKGIVCSTKDTSKSE